MADPREFVLIGSFKDGITPELQKINNELAKLKTNFAGVGSKKNSGFRGAAKEIGKLVSAHKNLSSSIKDVQGDLKSTLGVLKQYRREMGKAAAATRAFQKSGGSLGSKQFSQNMESANRSAQAYLRTLQQINAQSRRMPRGGMGGGFQPPRPPRGGGGGGMRPPSSSRGGGGDMRAHMGEFGFAYTLGSNIAQPIQNAIVAGFQIGVGFMTKPFEYFANAFGERVQDQISDLKAAGGLFSISKRSKTPFLKTIDEAIQFQQDTNQVFAKMAASLPGVTNDYVQVGKRLSDTMGRIAAGDFQNALQEANRIRSTQEGRKFYGDTITGAGPEATKEVLTTLLGEMTKKTTLAGMGGRSGAGGIAGAYGLPGLTERMLSQQEVSMGQFQRYAAVFSDPTIQDALSRNVDLVNSTLPNTTARFKAMQKLLDEVVTPELVEKLRTSVDGIYQGLRASILDPDTGLFGLGRQFENFAYKINQYGEYVVDKEGRRVKDSLSIFELVADIFSNAGQALLPIVDSLRLVFDPLKKVATILVDARHYAAEFNRTFNMYRKGLEKLSEVKGNDFLADTLDVRASLSAISNLLYQFGAIDKGEFESIGKQLLSKDLNIGAMLKRLIDSVLNSKIAEEIGSTIGEIIGTVLSEVAGVTGFLSGRIASSNKLFKGLKKGFDKAGGTEAFKNIFKDVFMSLFNVLKEVLKILPLEAYFLAGLAVIAPAAIQGLAMSFASRLWGGMQGLMNVAGLRMMDQLKKQAGRFTRVKPVTVTDLGPVITDPRRMLPGTTGGAIVPAGGAGATGGAGIGAMLGRLLPLLSKLTLVLAAIVMVGGGVENTFRQLSQALSEMAANVGGIFDGLFDSLGVVTSMMGDLGRRINEMVGSIFGAKEGFDLLKIILAIITLPLQLISQGLRGLAVGLANVRLWFAKLTGDRKAKEIEAERDALDAKLASDRGRINAYNASMLGPEAVKKQVNDAKYELANSKNIGRIRREELNAFIAAGSGKGTPPPPAAAGGAAPAALAAAAAAAPQTGPLVDSAKATSVNTQQISEKATSHLTHASTTSKNTAAANITLGNIRMGLIAISNKLSGIQSAILGDLNNIQAGVSRISSLLASGNLKVKADFNMPGGLPGGGSGGPAIFGSAAQKFGLQMTSGYRPGDPGYHGINRARDYSNGSGPTPQMMAFAQYLYSTFGSNLKELIYTPLGFSVKNGQKVPPYAQASHYNHVHVAWAFGPRNPVGFGSLGAAQAWERSMIPGSAKVASVTANSMEGLGGSSVGDIYVTVNAGATNDPDQLAYLVAERIQAAVGDAVNSNILV